MKKVFTIIIVGIFAISTLYFLFVYYVPYSEGTRAGELIKFSKKGVISKTWEGEISQGISGAEIFKFSVNDEEVIEKLNTFQGFYVKLKYIERYNTFFFWGDTKYFITSAEKSTSPHFNKKE